MVNHRYYYSLGNNSHREILRII